MTLILLVLLVAVLATAVKLSLARPPRRELRDDLVPLAQVWQLPKR